MLRQLSRALSRRLAGDERTHSGIYEFKERVAALFAVKYPGQECPRFSVRFKDGILFVRGEQRVHAAELARERSSLTDIARGIDDTFTRVVVS